MIALPLLLVVLASVYLIIGLVILAQRKPGYSQIRHTISELGEIGSPVQRAAGFGLFLPLGLLFLLISFLVQSAVNPAATIALYIAVGYLVAAFFPCDPGSPAVGRSTRQTIHNLGGAVQYVGSGLTLINLGETLGQAIQLVGFAIVALAVAFSFLQASSVRGLVQRVAEGLLFGVLALLLWQ
jgi:Protein of unknown function (DUF998)